MKNKALYFGFITIVLTLCVLSGCATKPAVGGFPLIDIVDAEVEIADDSAYAVVDSGEWSRSANTKVIGGPKGTRITARDITIRLIETSIQVPIREGTDISHWFLNIPTGLTAKAHGQNPESKNAVERGATEIIATIEGIPDIAINQPIKIRVPYEYTNRAWDFDIPPDEDLRFEVYAVDIESVVVGGAVNREIDSKTFKLVMGGTKLANAIDANTDISSWFKNLPKGLKAVIAEDVVPLTKEQEAQKQPKVQQNLQVTISGTPSVQVYDQMNIVIPASITTASIELRIPSSERALFDIGSYSKISGSDIELRTGSNWKGAISGWGLTGPEVFKVKDFTPVGIVQIESESVYAIGEDGDFHWTGDTITYGKLMAEAKKLNAHAIIDVVIDSDDQVSETVERRHVEANHVRSNLEQKKFAAALIKEEADPNGGIIYVETIRTTKRTSTGTALAIQYAPAYQPAVGDGGAIGYIPALPNAGYVPVPNGGK
ncbi:hypothetical protein AGMMS49944_15580 [Spirochaetia bacterium]|nr:hypothetical protein AGMMS49944_15580 [Spirochaetia bacterium]